MWHLNSPVQRLHVIVLLCSELSGFQVKATIKKFTLLNLSEGQGIVYILGRLTQKASLLACTALLAFPLRLYKDWESALPIRSQFRERKTRKSCGKDSCWGVWKRECSWWGWKHKHNNCSLNRKCFCCKGIFLGQRSKTYNHVIMMSPVHMSASPLLLCHVFWHFLLSHIR